MAQVDDSSLTCEGSDQSALDAGADSLVSSSRSPPLESYLPTTKGAAILSSLPLPRELSERHCVLTSHE